MKLQLKEYEKLDLAWSGGGNKKIHILYKSKNSYESFYPVCGSGVNSAGQTFRQSSKHGLLLAETVESELVCSKCLKSEYVMEVK